MIIRMHKVIHILFIGFSLLGANASIAESDQHHRIALETSNAFMQKLAHTMKTEMKANGPVSAIKVCTEMSPKIAGDISRDKGWRVTRVGTRVRNPMLAAPDAWEQKVLAHFQTRAAKGEALHSMVYSEMVEEPNGKYFRFMKAIGVKQVCLTCHGSESDIPDSVKAILSERYPHDKAIGYEVGDLRGAVSIKQPVADM